MKLKLGFLLLLCPFFMAQAQVNTISGDALGTLKPLLPGQQVPPVVLKKVLNKDSHTLNLADFRGKLLILDFWATSCGACIAAMPRLDSLQKLFGDRIVILPVTAEKAAYIARFQQNNVYLKGRRFPTVVEDQDLHALFPHRLLPHEVWIDSSGKLLGFTEVDAVSANGINHVLAGGGLTAPEKADVLDYDPNKPLLANHNGGADTAYRYRSVITGKLTGLPASLSIRYDTVKKLTIIRATNVTVRRLYNLAFNGLRQLPDSAVNLGEERGLFCYELDLPAGSSARWKQSMREDLDRFFNVRSAFNGSTFRLLPVQKDEQNNDPLTL